MCSKNNNKIKLADFGFSCMYNPRKGDKMDDYLGTSQFLAPEIIRKQPYNEKVDVWAVGIIMFILL